MILGIIELLKKTKHSCCQTTKVLIREQSVISTVPLEVINGVHGQLVHFRRDNKILFRFLKHIDDEI